jgi:hypothetical protein
MTYLRPLVAATAVLSLAAVSSLRADVKTEERTRFELGGMLGKVAGMFGGKDEGTMSTIAVKGQRQSMVTDSAGQIIDLAEEKVYQLDVRRKTYRVATFAQIRQQMEEARAKTEKAMREEQAKQKEDVASAQKQIQDSMEIDLDVRKTGQSRTINGHNTNQVLVVVTVREKGKTLEQSGGMQITSDMWMAPQIPALKEVTDFQIEYAKKLYGPMLQGASPQDMASAMALYPMLKPALERMNAEKDKVQGTAILTTVKVEGVKSAEQFAQEQKQREDGNKPSVSGGVGGLLGGLARRAAQNKVQGDVQQRSMVMTTTTEVLKIATDVPASDVAIPAGFKQQ